MVKVRGGKDSSVDFWFYKASRAQIRDIPGQTDTRLPSLPHWHAIAVGRYTNDEKMIAWVGSGAGVRASRAES
jgi:hypothetical protein